MLPLPLSLDWLGMALPQRGLAELGSLLLRMRRSTRLRRAPLEQRVSQPERAPSWRNAVVPPPPRHLSLVSSIF